MDRIDVALTPGKPFQTLLDEVLRATERKKFKPTPNQMFYLKLVAQRHGINPQGVGGPEKKARSLKSKVIKTSVRNNYEYLYQILLTETTGRTRKGNIYAYNRSVILQEGVKVSGVKYIRYRNPKNGQFIKKPRWAG